MSACPACSVENPSESKFCGGCGKPLAEPVADAGLIGRTIADRYRVTRVIAEGGMGIVYEAVQSMGEGTRPVAIKTLLPELSHDHIVVSRFTRECAVVASLEHPNTVRVYDFGKTFDGILYIAMEYVRGRPLGDVMAEGKMPLNRCLPIVEQIALALGEAHALGIVHRDLKPDNLVLCERAGIHDFVKLLDFGIAMRSSQGGKRDTKLTQQGMVLGTPPYMSPEQFTAEALDQTSDVYSLAVIVYEMLCGRLPFDAETPWQWAHHHLSSTPAPFSDPSTFAVERVVMQALDKRRENRPKGTLEFFQQLARAAGVIPERARGNLAPQTPRTEPPSPALVPGPSPGVAPAPHVAGRRIDRTEPSLAMSSVPTSVQSRRGVGSGRPEPVVGDATEPNLLALVRPSVTQAPVHSAHITPVAPSLQPAPIVPKAPQRSRASTPGIGTLGPRHGSRRRWLWVGLTALSLVGGAAAALAYTYYYYEPDVVPPLPTLTLGTDDVGTVRDIQPESPKAASNAGAIPGPAQSEVRGPVTRGDNPRAPAARPLPGLPGLAASGGATSAAATGMAASGAPQVSPIPGVPIQFPFPLTLPTAGIPLPFPQGTPPASTETAGSTPSPAGTTPAASPQTTPSPQAPTASYCQQASQLAATDLNRAIDQYELCRANASSQGSRIALSGLVSGARLHAAELARQGRCAEVQGIRNSLSRLGRQGVVDGAVAGTACAAP